MNVDYPTFEQLIKQELTKFDVVIPAVNELAQEFMPLKIESIEDKDGYAQVSKALKFVISKRTAVEEKRKELKADSLAFGRAVDARAKEITAMLSPIEEHLKNEKAKIDAEIERIKQEEEKRKQEVINSRSRRLFDLGVVMNMTEFIWTSKLSNEVIEMPKINLEIFSDEEFEEAYLEFKRKIDAENTIIAEREAKEKAEREALEAEKLKVQLEMQKLQDEILQVKKLRAESRFELLKNLKLISGRIWGNNLTTFNFIRANSEMVAIIPEDDVLNMGSSEWDAKYEEIKKEVENLRQIESETARKLKEEEEAKARKLEEAAAEKARLEEENRIELEKKRVAEELELEKQRVANMSDKEIFLTYVDALKKVPTPALKTKKWQGYVATLIKTIDTFQKYS